MDKKTPAQGPIDAEPPRAMTQEEVQESWHKAKNLPVQGNTCPSL